MRVPQTKQRCIQSEIFPLYSHIELLKYAQQLPSPPLSASLRSFSDFRAPFMCLFHFVCHSLALTFASLLQDSIQSNSVSFISQLSVPDNVNRIIKPKGKPEGLNAEEHVLLAEWGSQLLRASGRINPCASIH